MPKLDDRLDITWAAMNVRNTNNSNLRRSMLRVSSIIGSEVSETIHAYTVSIRPTCAVVMSKLWPMALNKPTGTNSVVLKMKAANASAMTLSQLPVGGLVVFIKTNALLNNSVGRVPSKNADKQEDRSRRLPGRCVRSAEYYEYGEMRRDVADSTPL